MTSLRGAGTGPFLLLDHVLVFPNLGVFHRSFTLQGLNYSSASINPILCRGRGGPSVSDGGGPGILSARGVQPTVAQPR